MRVWGPELWSPEPSDMLAGHGSLSVTTAWEGSYRGSSEQVSYGNYTRKLWARLRVLA